MEFQPKQGTQNKLEQEISEAEILKRLKLYHETSKAKWEAIKNVGAILSEKELLERGLIVKEQLEEFETTSTGDLDREEGRDQYVFASHAPANYGEVTLEIDVSALGIKDAKVATAGDWMHFVDSDEDKKYFRDSEIPASQFVKYLSQFLKTLPDPEWFWGKKDPRLEKMLKEGLLGNSDKMRQFWKLYPEIMFPRELPLEYIKSVNIRQD